MTKRFKLRGRLLSTIRSFAPKKRKDSYHGARHSQPGGQGPGNPLCNPRPSDQRLMLTYAHLDLEAHQRSLETQRRIKRSIFRGSPVDWKAIPVFVDDEEDDDGVDAGGSDVASPLLESHKCHDTSRPTLIDPRGPTAAVSRSPEAAASGTKKLFDMIG